MRPRFLPLALFLPSLLHAAPEPVIRWDFGTEETSKLVAHGGVHRDIPGPRPPQFPDFEPENAAVQFDGGGAYFAYPTQGPDSPMIFRQGDAITIEAWVNLAQINKGENAYVIGKGRTGTPGFAADNQNWALRVREADGLAHISFLFATPKVDGAKGKDAHWHRWTSTAGIASGSGWHRLAVSYRFGSPETIAGWVDEKPTAGAWDMGGATQDPPVADEDAVWIGSSMKGSASNSFRGLLDSIAIFRELVPDALMRSRFRREGKADEPAPAVVAAPVEYPAAPAGRVLVTFHEGLALPDKLPKPDEAAPPETLRWLTDDFVIPRLPLRYDAWGIRDGWKGPVLLRAVGEIKLPPGEHRFLLRSRGVSRLSINGAPIATLKPRTGGSGGYEKIKPVPEPPLPGLRPLGFGDQEVFGTAKIGADGKCSLVLEVIVGAAKKRSEPGELCVAIELPEQQTLVFVQTSSESEKTPLTDAGWLARSARSESALAALDDANRRTLAASQDAFWEKRHAFGAAVFGIGLGHSGPQIGKPGPVVNPIDLFLTAKVEQALTAAKEGRTAEGAQFHEEVFPVLRDNCFRCHGEKEKGDLRLNTREAALKAGTSGHAAIVPGAPAKSELLARLKSHDADERMPPKEPLKPEQIAAIETWISHGAPWPAPQVTAAEVRFAPPATDAALLRRLYLDTVGVPPSEAEARAYLADQDPAKVEKLIDRLLADDRFADGWMGYWQDVLAENPSMLKPSLNNSGPFRWFLQEALRDRKPFDRVITELVMMRGSAAEGGSAGFGMAADNDAPLAAKAQILASAFLGLELQCARCHDAPFHSSTQRDLYALSAMLRRENVTVPKSSTVPAAFFEKKTRESLIKVTLKPGETVKPEWPLEKFCGFSDGPALAELMQNPTDTRERLAVLLTAPQNRRVPQVIANRVWKRLMGAGMVEPAHDWEGHAASHQQALAWLADSFVANNWDFRFLVKTILTSRAYQAQPLGANLVAGPEGRFFPAPDRRRLTAEEVVDSLFAATGRRIEVEELSFDPDSRQSTTTMISLGNPKRAWEFASLSNERDRPSLALPRAQAVTDVLEAFGWSGSRQNPRTDRETDPSVLQPGILANSTLTLWLTRASAGSELAELALQAKSPEALVESIFLRVLSRFPTDAERARFAKALTPGFDTRVTNATLASLPTPLERLPRISWTNHLTPESTTIKNEQEKRARAGDAPDPRLTQSWRETYEDFVWALLNLPEFVWKP